MDTQEILKQIKEIGFPIATLAKRINKDPSTIQKWSTGKNKYLAADTEAMLIEEIKRIKEFWVNLKI